jgi:translation initiation factor 3 subunit B
VNFPPLLKFSPDDQYIARLIRDAISVYALPSIEEKILKADNVSDIEWSPGSYPNNQNIIAYSSVESDNIPARVGLLEVPSKNSLRFKTLINVEKISLIWQSLGDYLACNVAHRLKSKTRKTYNIELFRVRENQVPVEILNFGEQTIISFAWEPKGDRFAVIHEEFGVTGASDIKVSPDSSPVAGADGSINSKLIAPESVDKRRRITKISVSFFRMVQGGPKSNLSEGNKKKKPSKQTKKNEVHFLFKLENRKCTSIHWSPEGNFVILARIPKGNEFDELIDASVISGNSSTFMEFIDVYNMKSYASMELKNVNSIQWDPSGRFVTSAMCSRQIQLAKSRFTIHTFLGQHVSSQEYDSEFDFKWRPRPKSLLSEAEKKIIISEDLKRFEDELQSQDMEAHLLKVKLKREENESKRFEFRTLLTERLEDYQQKRPQVMELRNILDEYDSED